MTIHITGSGIDFSGNQTNHANMTSEVLDQYEEGTWSPTYTTTGVNSTVAYSVQTGYYVRTGQHLKCWFVLQSDATTWNGTYIQAGGLPFAAINSRIAGYITEAYGFGGDTPMFCFNAATTRWYMSYRDAVDGSTEILRADDMDTGNSKNTCQGFLDLQIAS